MKKIFIPISIFAIVTIIFSCNTVEQPPNYTYSIDSVWWSDAVDGNADGYAKFERLNFDVHLKENTSQTIVGRVYYKLKDASDFSFYAFSEDKRIIGNNAENNLFVSIGSPNIELQRGIYDFNIEIYQTDQNDIKATSDSLQLITLSNKKFELPQFDNTYTMNLFWENQFDKNGNAYNRYATLVIDVNNNEQVTRNIDAKIYYKLSTDKNFQLYFEKNNFTISGQSLNDTVSVLISGDNGELEKGEYDFRVDVFEAGKDRLLDFEDNENPILSKQKFETEDDDSYYYSFSNIWWSDSTDIDKDSYTSLRKLHFDVDVDKNETRTLFAKIYLRPESTDSTDYETFYDSTANFSITGTNASDAYFVWIGNDTTALDSNRYDILISIYDALVDSPQVVETTVSGFTQNELKLQKFETASQDSL